MNAFASAAVMIGPAVPVIDVSVAGRLAVGVWPVLCKGRELVGVAGAVAAALADPADHPATPGTRKHAPLACESVTTFVRSCSHIRYTRELQWPHTYI